MDILDVNYGVVFKNDPGTVATAQLVQWQPGMQRACYQSPVPHKLGMTAHVRNPAHSGSRGKPQGHGHPGLQRILGGSGLYKTIEQNFLVVECTSQRT